MKPSVCRDLISKCRLQSEEALKKYESRVQKIQCAENEDSAPL